MITKETIDRIFETVRIEEVVGDFVHLKKRGVNLLGVCPFHNEKTPSFTVSPIKGIYKCFGCGKAGNSVNFIMEHEKLSYPEALRYLAQKYNIELEEDYTLTEEDQLRHGKRESLLILNDYAKKYFIDLLWNTEEGKNIGLSYFKERGFREDSIKKFELGYSINEWDHLTKKAIAEGYVEEFLEETGLSIRNEQKHSLYDRFRGRVLFPVHNLTGRVVAFGGRILKTDPKNPKYVNSPESEIYHKSSILYGAYFAKKSIREQDNCYLVEGYTDVISLHQSGIENVVASSGTSLTTEQIRLISRFTKNITILYDGDPAGIKASLRGIEMILEEGLNVKVVLFPEGHDPDSYVREVGGTLFENYIKENQKDFILFKASLLLEEVKNDPIRKADLIREMVETIAKIPDNIKASLFIKECSSLMDIEERILFSELNNIKVKKIRKENKLKDVVLPDQELAHVIKEPAINKQDEHQEYEIIRLLFTYGSYTNWHREMPELTVAEYIIEQLNTDNIEFHNVLYKEIIDLYKTELNNKNHFHEHYFTNHERNDIRELAATILVSPHTLSDNWITHDIIVPQETQRLKASIISAINHLKMKKILRLIEENKENLKTITTEEEVLKYQEIHQHLTELKMQLSREMGTVIPK